MSYSIIQTPASCSLAQSPVIFTVSSSVLVGQPDFTYVGELSIWTGSVADSSSAEVWQLAKYPSIYGFTGIFDVSRILNSTQTWLTQTTPSGVSNFKFDTYTRYLSGSTTYITGSHVVSNVYQALDGYQVFPEMIGAELPTLTQFFPLLTDGPSTQSVFIGNVGSGSVWCKETGTNGAVTSIAYSGSNGSNAEVSMSAVTTDSNTFIQHFPIAGGDINFPISEVGLSSYTIQAKVGSTFIGEKITYEIGCQQKYPNIRIKWKNRFGQFDYFNFNMVSRQSIGSDKHTYQPQLGTWAGRTLSYNEWDSQNLNYIVDSKQQISVNTFWVSEDYNDIFKQLLVSDEIYWMQEDTLHVKPITIVTNSIQFKTGVVDGLIQYAFDFQYGQGYKLII